MKPPIEGDKFIAEGKTLVFMYDRPRQWSCKVCEFWDVHDCEAHLLDAGLPDCFTNHGYYAAADGTTPHRK